MNNRFYMRIVALIAACLALPLAVDGAESIAPYYARAKTGLLPVAAAEGRILLHTRQFLAFEGNTAKLRSADLSTQVMDLLGTLNEKLRGYEASLTYGLRLNVYLSDDSQRPIVQGHLENFFTGKTPPLSFVTGDLPHPDALVGMDAVAQSFGAAPLYSINKGNFLTPRSGRFGAEFGMMPIGAQVFVSGQAVRGKDVKEATHKTMEQLGGTLDWLGLKWKDVIHIKSFLRPMDGVDDALSTIRTFFPSNAVPPLAFVEWQNRNPIEIELVVAGGEDNPERPAVEYLTPKGMKASPVFTRVVRVNRGKIIYTSGICGTPGTDPEREVRDVFKELQKAVGAFQSDLKHLVKATYYVKDNQISKALNELRPEFYDPKRPPAASKATVKGAGLKGQRIMVDMIAVSAP